jgi:serine phosphatase RsbU (regulator of sigma subunit)
VSLDHRIIPVPDEAAGAALGVVEGAFWPGFDFDLDGGCRLMLFTDGLIEGYDGEGGRARLGEEGMHRLLDDIQSTDPGANALADALLAEVRRRNGGELTDDVALLLLSWTDQA